MAQQQLLRNEHADLLAIRQNDDDYDYEEGAFVDDDAPEEEEGARQPPQQRGGRQRAPPSTSNTSSNNHNNNRVSIYNNESKSLLLSSSSSSFPVAVGALGDITKNAFPRFAVSGDFLSESNFEFLDGEHDNGSVGGDSSIVGKKNAAVKEVTQVAQREILGIRLWKALFLSLALATAGVVSAGTYIFIKDEEYNDYQDSYELFVNAMHSAVQVHVNHIVTVFDSLAKMISSDAAGQGVEFPFYTMNNFEATGEGIRALSKAEMYSWMPFVEPEQLPAWINYSNSHQDWLETSRQWALRSGEFSVVNKDYQTGPITPIIYDFGGPGGTPQPSQGTPPYAPSWQTSPPVFNPATINLDFNFFEFAATASKGLQEARHGFWTRVLVPGETGSLIDLIFKDQDHQDFHQRFVDWDYENHTVRGQPHGAYMQPVFQDAQNPTGSKMVGYIAVALAWDAYLVNLLPDGVSGIYCVVRNTCEQALTYKVIAKRAYFVGWGDYHDTSYDYTERIIPFYQQTRAFGIYTDEGQQQPGKGVAGQCIYSFYIYATQEYEDLFRSNMLLILTCVVTGAFFFLIFSYFMYDWFVERRNRKIVSVAAKSGEIVSSLFPKQVRDRLYNNHDDYDPIKQPTNGFEAAWPLQQQLEPVPPYATNTKQQQQAMFPDADIMSVQGAMDDEGFMYKTRPIADLYPHTTIMFADIAGFTAWSSTREPTQVFRLLETLYKAFDTYAKRRRVFKVETIGDCYVAVTGLPEPMADHAVVMCRFAKDCLNKMRELTRRLESVLGPDTMDLDMRFGLHSGSVTAGVLRGDKSRFQLFGDTMNTASRMESTGRAGMIHISQETADLLIKAGKSHWIKPREDKVYAKGKGVMQTYWVTTSSRDYGSDSGRESQLGDKNILSGGSGHESFADFNQRNSDVDVIESKMAGLIKWNVEVLTAFLNRIAQQRVATDNEGAASNRREWDVLGDHSPPPPPPESALSEYRTAISFPMASSLTERSPKPLPQEAFSQLEHFVSAIASLYSDHPYHCFSHASHVTMGLYKLLLEFRTGDDGETEEPQSSSPHSPFELNPVLLLETDPVAQFAAVLASLVQDVDHEGVPNFVLAAEEEQQQQLPPQEDASGETTPASRRRHRRRCISQLRAIDRTWNLLMSSHYDELRAAIYQTPAEKQHFRQVFVQCVLATDLSDKAFTENRKTRWNKAFGSILSSKQEQQPQLSVKSRLNLQATLILEVMIQASDVIHALQHWDVYRKWNGYLFEEIYKAYTQGRMLSNDNNPAEQWYRAELGFFDTVVFPMVIQRLQDVSQAFKSGAVEVYIDFARRNRALWEEQGPTIVAEMLRSDQSSANE